MLRLKEWICLACNKIWYLDEMYKCSTYCPHCGVMLNTLKETSDIKAFA